MDKVVAKLRDMAETHRLWAVRPTCGEETLVDAERRGQNAKACMWLTRIAAALEAGSDDLWDALAEADKSLES